MNGKPIVSASFAVLSLALLIQHSGCRKGQEPDRQTTFKLGVSMSTFSSPYASATVREFERYARENGFDLIIVDSQLDIQKEASNIDNLMALKVDAILVNVVDSKGSRAALQKAAEAGFVVICANSTVHAPESLGIRAYTGPEYYEQAATAARVAMKLCPKGNAVVITGTPGYSAAIDREKGFTDTIGTEAPGIRILDVQTANWMREDAQRVMADYVTKYGEQIDIVYCQDDTMTAGAVAALRAAGYTLKNKPVVVSIGAMADGLPLVRDGWIDATIMQSPREECRLAVDTAIAINEGKQTESYRNYFMQTPPVDKSNVQKVIGMRLWDDS